MTNWLKLLADIHVRSFIKGYRQYRADWKTYSSLPYAEPLHEEDAFPQLYDRLETTPFDSHYFYQAVWASKLIASHHAPIHVDIGSQINLIALLPSIVPTVFVDIRPLEANVEGLNNLSGSILEMPFADTSIHSVSCLHVVEHIGLGRYGDPLNPQGTKLALAELCRVVAPGGHLYLSTPIGRPRVCFNAHRIHSPAQILEYCAELELSSFSVVDDQNRFIQNGDWQQYLTANYACGMFNFIKH